LLQADDVAAAGGGALQVTEAGMVADEDQGAAAAVGNPAAEIPATAAVDQPSVPQDQTARLSPSATTTAMASLDDPALESQLSAGEGSGTTASKAEGGGD
jgi:hypothetical protein